MAEHYYAACCLCLVSPMLSVPYKLFMLNSVALSVILMSVVVLRFVAPKKASFMPNYSKMQIRQKRGEVLFVQLDTCAT